MEPPQSKYQSILTMSIIAKSILPRNMDILLGANPQSGARRVSMRVRHNLVRKCKTRAQCNKTFLSVIYELSYKAIVFVRVAWKSLPRTNTIAFKKTRKVQTKNVL